MFIGLVVLNTWTTSNRNPKMRHHKKSKETIAEEVTLPIQGFFSTKVSEFENGLVKIYWDLNDMRQDDPTLIEFLKKEILIPPPDKKQPLNFKTTPKLNGQFNQVPKIEEILGLTNPTQPNPTSGFYIEAGAADGESISNTLYFEMHHGWTGLLVEPNPDNLAKLIDLNRNAWILPHCLSTKSHVEMVTFEISDLLSGIVVDGKTKPSKLNDAWLDLSKWFKPEDNDIQEIQVQCFPLFSVLVALGNPHIDYFSLDIEGAEWTILKSLPWDRINVTALTVEINHAGETLPGSQSDIRQLMQQKGYELAGTLTIDDLFYRKDLNRFST